MGTASGEAAPSSSIAIDTELQLGTCSPDVFERLEDRLLLSVSQDANGWTVVTPAADSRLIYVSISGGSDNNNGFSPAAPVASLLRAYNLVRNGSSDQILLHRGDQWNGTFPKWTKSGRSSDEPILIGTYGAGTRPVLNTAYVMNAFDVPGPNPVSYVVMQGLYFHSAVRDPNSPDFDPVTVKRQYSGLRWTAPSDGFTIEDCAFRYYMNNLDVEGLDGPVHNVVLRRILSADSYNTFYHSQGFYGLNIDGLTVEQSVFDHDGWNEQISGAGQTGYNHDVYMSSTVVNATFRQNIFANASNNGLLVRGGGNIEDNLFVGNAAAIGYGGAPASMSAVGGVKGSIVGNVIAGNRSLGSSPYGVGFVIANTAPGSPTLVADNVFTGDSQHASPAMTLQAAWSTKNPAAAVGINDVIIQSNVFNGWFRAIQTDGGLVPGGSGLAALNRVFIRNNEFQATSGIVVRHDGPFDPTNETWQQNRYFDTPADGKWFVLGQHNITFANWQAQVDPTGVLEQDVFPDDSRNAGTYDGSIGGAGTVDSFVAAERLQSSDHWDPRYIATSINDYIREGFNAATAPIAAATTSPVDMQTVGTPPPPAMVSANVVSAASDAPTAADDLYTFTVAYADTQALDAAGIGSGNVDVVGPNGFDESATLVSMTQAADGKTADATYSITPPGGSWDGADDGQYAVMMQPGQVRNKAGVGVPEGAIGAFGVSLPLDIVGTAGNDRIGMVALPKNRLLVVVNGKRTIYSLSNVPEVRVFGGDGNDLIVAGTGAPSCYIDGGAGNDRVRGGPGNDTILGGDGNDLIGDVAGQNILIGGAGDDVLIGGNGFDRMAGVAGNDLLIGGASSSDDPTALAAMRDSWSALDDAGKTATLAQPTFMIGNAAFSDDGIVDRLYGGAGNDWFTATDQIVQ